MIETQGVLAEFVLDLGDEFCIDAINEHGVAFYYRPLRNVKFNVIKSPMFGIKEGYIGFVVVKNSYPCIDGEFKIEDPELLQKIQYRILHWITGEEYRPAPTELTRKFVAQVK